MAAAMSAGAQLNELMDSRREMRQRVVRRIGTSPLACFDVSTSVYTLRINSDVDCHVRVVGCTQPWWTGVDWSEDYRVDTEFSWSA